MDSTMEDYRSQSKCIVYGNKIAAYMFNYINQLATYSEKLL